MSALSADMVAAGLADKATRKDTLTALEERSRGAYDAVLSVAAAAALKDTMTALAAEEPDWHRPFQWTARVLVELLEGAPLGAERDAGAGAAFGDQYRRQAALWAALAARCAAADALTLDDAVCVALMVAQQSIMIAGGIEKHAATVGMTGMEHLTAQVSSANLLFDAKGVSPRMVALALELLSDPARIPDGAAAGLWLMLDLSMNIPGGIDFLADSDVFSLAMAHLSTIGTPADCIVHARGKVSVAGAVLNVLGNVNPK